MMQEYENITYLGLCIRYEPPLIGIHYKSKPNDVKKKLYNILLNNIVLNPDPLQAAYQLYQEHPHILKQEKIPVNKIAQLILKIQNELQINCEEPDEEQPSYEEDYEEEQPDHDDPPANFNNKPREVEAPQKPKGRPKFDFNAPLSSNHALNKSL